MTTQTVLFILLIVQCTFQGQAKLECVNSSSGMSCKSTSTTKIDVSFQVPSGMDGLLVIINMNEAPQDTRFKDPNSVPPVTVVPLSVVASKERGVYAFSCRNCEHGQCVYSREEFESSHTIINDDLYTDKKTPLVFIICNANYASYNSPIYQAHSTQDVQIMDISLGSFGVLSFPYFLVAENAKMNSQFRRRYYNMMVSQSHQGSFPFDVLICRKQGLKVEGM